MGEHNNAMCGFFSREENYADFWNGILFQGRQKIKPEELEQTDKEYFMINNNNTQRKGKTKELRRDVLMKKCAGEKTDILLGMELMDTIDYTMPVRKMMYDAQEFQRQMCKVIRHNRENAKKLAAEENHGEKSGSKKYWRNSGEFLYGLRKEDKLPPLITVALYCGTEQYDGCKDLKDMLGLKQIDAEYRKWIIGYPLHIVVLQDLQEEYFQSGLRELIGVLKRSTKKASLLQYYQENQERFARLDDLTIETIGILIGNKKLVQFKQEQGGLDMCKAFEDAKMEGLKEGLKEGLLEGEERYARLTKELCMRQRMTDILKAATNMEYRNQLFQEFSI